MFRCLAFLPATFLLARSQPLRLPLHLDAGGTGPFKSIDGTMWIPDSSFISTGTVYTAGGAAIAGTRNDRVFQSERWFSWDESSTYLIPLEDNVVTVEVRLLFAEVYYKSANKRVFDILIDGKVVEDRFDIFASAGQSNRAVLKSYIANISNGNLQIELRRKVENPNISGIIVLNRSTGVTEAPTASPLDSSLPLYINAGDTKDYTSMDGTVWVPDATFISSGDTFTDKSTGIADTENNEIFQTERWFLWGESSTYVISVPKGVASVEVHLLFAEVYFKAPGKRVFAILVNGEMVEKNFDIYSVAGQSHKAVIVTKVVPVVSGVVEVELRRKVQNPKINAIVILEYTGNSPVIPPAGFHAANPTYIPTTRPELTDQPTTYPISLPTNRPTAAPVFIPKAWATDLPTNSPTSNPTKLSISGPTLPVEDPTASPVNKWVEIDPNADIQARHEACFVMVNNPTVGQRAYLVGGRGERRTDVFDTNTRTWSIGAKPPLQMHHMQCVAAQGKLWIVAAWIKWYPYEENAKYVYVYDPATNSWSTRTAMPEERRRGGAAVVVSADQTKIYVSHGNDGGHETGDHHAVSLGYLDVYDIATDSWTALSDDGPNPRDHCGGALINGRICVAGGRDGGTQYWPEVAPTDCYDLESGTWSVEADIPQVRAGSSYGTTCGGKLMVAGGEGSGKAWDQVDVFDGSSWTTIDSLVIGRHGSGIATDCIRHEYIIASGASAQGGGPEVTSVEVYTESPLSKSFPTMAMLMSEPAISSSTTPITLSTSAQTPLAVEGPQMFNKWIEIDSNADIQARHEACFVMVDNPTVGQRAYLVGGRGERRTDIFDTETRTWSIGAEPPLQMHHMQCVAAQGKLWIVAAWIKWYPYEENAEFVYVYDPATDSWSTKTAMPEERRRGGAAVVVSDDQTKIYVSHGNSGGHETGDNHAVSLGYLDVYDIAADSWAALSDDGPNPRDHCGGALINGRICVGGGRDGGALYWPEVAPTDCYDLASGTWSVEADIPQVRAGSSYGTTCGGKLMVAGGEGSGKAWDQVDVFDGSSWTTIDSLAIGRHGSGIATDCIRNEYIIASGASAQGGGPEIKSVEIYRMGG